MPPILKLCIMAVMGILCAFIAHSRGRSAVGWFFIGLFFSCLGLIVLLVIPDLKKLEAEKAKMLKENRRLRGEVRLNREAANRQSSEVAARLKVHDRALGIDTTHSENAQISSTAAAHPISNATETKDSPHAAKQWYFMDDAGSQGPVTFKVLHSLWKAGQILPQYYVKSSDMKDWSRVEELPNLREALDA